MYVYCVYPAMSKNQQQKTPAKRLLDRAEVRVIHVVIRVSSVTPALD
jgi:hypothetical protein